MKISAKEEKRLLAWGVRFFEMGYQAAIDNQQKLMPITKELKISAVKIFINKVSGQ